MRKDPLINTLINNQRTLSNFLLGLLVTRKNIGNNENIYFNFFWLLDIIWILKKDHFWFKKYLIYQYKLMNYNENKQ